MSSIHSRPQAHSTASSVINTTTDQNPPFFDPYITTEQTGGTPLKINMQFFSELPIKIKEEYL